MVGEVTVLVDGVTDVEVVNVKVNELPNAFGTPITATRAIATDRKLIAIDLGFMFLLHLFNDASFLNFISATLLESKP